MIVAVRAGVDAVVAAIGVRLQKTLEILEERGRAVAGMRRRVIEDDARMIVVADVVPQSAVAVSCFALVADRHRGVVGVQHLRLQHPVLLSNCHSGVNNSAQAAIQSHIVERDSVTPSRSKPLLGAVQRNVIQIFVDR